MGKIKNIDPIAEENLEKKDDSKLESLDEILEGVPEEQQEVVREMAGEGNKEEKDKTPKNSNKNARISEHPLKDQQQYLDTFLNENKPIGSEEQDVEVVEATYERLSKEKNRRFDLFIKIGEDRTKFIEKVITDINNIPIFDTDGKIQRQIVYKPIMEKYIVRRPRPNEELDLSRYGIGNTEELSIEKYEEAQEAVHEYLSTVIEEPKFKPEDWNDFTADKIRNVYNKCIQLQNISDESLLMDFFSEY